MNKQKIIFTITLGLLSLFAFGQSSLPFNGQFYIMDKVLINPSFTGSTEYIVAKASHRRQWDNMPDGPKTTLASVHANIVDRVGLGMYFMNDHNGNTKTNSFNISAAYHIPIGSKKGGEEGQFSFGTSLSFAGMHFRGWTEVPNDPIFNDDETRVYIPYINFGASATYKGWMLGLSVLDIPLSYNDPIVNQYEPSPKFYYGMLAKTIHFTSEIEVQPMVTYRSNFDKLSQLDAGLKGTYKFDDNAVWAGANYRMGWINDDNHSLTVSPMLGADIGRLNFGFAYDIDLSDVQFKANNGFTVVLGYNLENVFKPGND